MPFRSFLSPEKNECQLKAVHAACKSLTLYKGWNIIEPQCEVKVLKLERTRPASDVDLFVPATNKIDLGVCIEA